MPRGKETFTAQTNLPAYMRPRLEALAAHREQSLAAAVGDAVRDAVLKFEGDDTKDAKLDRIEIVLAELRRKVDILLLMVWSQSGGEAARLTADDVKGLRALLAEIQL